MGKVDLLGAAHAALVNACVGTSKRYRNFPLRTCSAYRATSRTDYNRLTMSNRVLRTISINFPFVSKAVVQETDLTTPKAFFDFDVLVIRPYPLRRLRTSSDFGVYFGLKDEMERKIGEI